MSSDIKVTYFDIKALGEPIRLLLSYGGVDFTDNRVPRSDWPKLKPKMPFGQVPLYEENGKAAHQHLAICRYVAKKVKLTGATDWEDLEIDAIVDTINDFRAKIGQYHYQSDASIKENLKGPLYKETIPYYLEKFDKIVKENKGHFALGKLTWADVYFVALLDYLKVMAGDDLIDKYANVKDLVKTVSAIPNIKAWLESRPKTE